MGRSLLLEVQADLQRQERSVQPDESQVNKYCIYQFHAHDTSFMHTIRHSCLCKDVCAQCVYFLVFGTGRNVRYVYLMAIDKMKVNGILTPSALSQKLVCVCCEFCR